MPHTSCGRWLGPRFFEEKDEGHYQGGHNAYREEGVDIGNELGLPGDFFCESGKPALGVEVPALRYAGLAQPLVCQGLRFPPGTE